MRTSVFTDGEQDKIRAWLDSLPDDMRLSPHASDACVLVHYIRHAYNITTPIETDPGVMVLLGYVYIRAEYYDLPVWADMWQRLCMRFDDDRNYHGITPAEAKTLLEFVPIYMQRYSYESVPAANRDRLSTRTLARIATGEIKGNEGFLI